MPSFQYTITGELSAPEGSTLNAAGNGIILPDGREVNVWEAFEIYDTNTADYKDLAFKDLEALGLSYVCSRTQVEEA